MAESFCRSMIRFLRNLCSVIDNGCISLRSQQQWFRVPFPCNLVTIFCFWVLFDSHSNWHEARTVWDFFFSVIVGHLEFFFSFVYWPFISHLLKLPSYILDPFLNRILCFVVCLSSCKSLLLKHTSNRNCKYFL